MRGRYIPARFAGVLRHFALRTVVVLAVLSGAAASVASAAEPGVGLSGPTSSQIAELKGLDTHWVRMFATWPTLEPGRGEFSPAWMNAFENGFKALPAGTKVILVVVDTPEWETGSSDPKTPPANPEDYATFMAALARRFAPWVSAYEIWNEEDSGWWGGGPDPAAYTELLKATYPAIKSADPAATVLVGGLTGNDYDFMEGIYAAGGKGYFDAVGVHTDTACNLRSPYEFVREPDRRLIPDAFLAYREVHAVMVANGDDKPIWMTEMSWRTTSAECAEGVFAGQKAGGVTEAQQATFLREAYHCLAEDPYVQVALWFPLQDEGVVTSGLLREDGSQKPAFAAMAAYARHGDTLHEACGNFAGPSIEVASPANGTTYSGPLPIDVTARSSEGVFRIRLEIDGKLIRNYDGDEFPSTLHGAIEWQGAKHISYGRHVLSILAFDKEMNISQQNITIYHEPPGAKANRSSRRKATRHRRRHTARHGHRH